VLVAAFHGQSFLGSLTHTFQLRIAPLRPIDLASLYTFIIPHDGTRRFGVARDRANTEVITLGSNI
jgi:hypothetical protein